MKDKKRNYRKGKKNRTPAEREMLADLFHFHVIKEGKRYSDFQAVTGFNPVMCRRYFMEYYVKTIAYRKISK
jgi:hypothetical protein